MHIAELNISSFFALRRVLLGFMILPMLAVAACTATDVAPSSDIDPTVNTLAALDQVEEFKVDGDLTIKRYQADAQSRFAIGISPLDGSQRERAFAAAESAFARICSSTGPGVGKLGRRAPLYSAEKSTYFVYMQCAGAPSAPVSGG